MFLNYLKALSKKRARIFYSVCLIIIMTFSGFSLKSMASAGVGAALEDMVDGEETGSESKDASVEDSDSESKEDSISGSNSESMNSLPAALSCSFILPEGFKASDTPGVFVNEHYPLESANITYSVHVIPQKKVLTNAEKASGKSDEGDVEFSYNELTGDRYEAMQKSSFESLYGENINYNLESFENVEIDGFLGYKIVQSYTPSGSQMIHQTSYIMLSCNKVFTIVFSRAEDDDFDEVFLKSMETIHIR